MTRSVAVSLIGAAILTYAGCCIAATSRAPNAHRSYVIDYYGDSTVLVPVARPDHTAPAVLQSELTRRCGFPVIVNTKAVTTTRAIDALNGTNGYPSSFTAAMANSKANMVIANYGINDARLRTSTADYRVAMQAIAQLARSHGKIMVFETPNPVVDGAQQVIWIGENQWLSTLSSTMTNLAKSMRLLVVNQYDYLTSQGNIGPLLFDGAHPTDATVRVKALRVTDVVQPYVCPTAGQLPGTIMTR